MQSRETKVSTKRKTKTKGKTNMKKQHIFFTLN